MMKFELNSMKILFYIIVIFYVNSTCVLAQSKAHDSSKFAIIDPAYSSNAIFPKSNLNRALTPWIYGASELECERLQILQQRKNSAKLLVRYPGAFHKSYTDGSFRLKLKTPQKLNSIRFRVVGQGNVYVNDLFVGSFSESDSIHIINLKKDRFVSQIQFDINTVNEPIALLIESKKLSTQLVNWEWKSKDIEWEPAFQHPQNFQNLPPHKLEDPTIILKSESVKNNLYDFGKELFGDITIRSESKPIINVGESEKEALDVNCKVKEQSLELVNISGDIWKTKNLVAFRYVYVENIQIEDISCDAIFHPSTYKGAFACSDSSLTQIWMNSAYTLRLCMHDFLVDGIKRDRLPWAGDLAMSLLVNAYSFSDPELVRRSLVALGRAGIKEKDINGIIDYSLWWIISQDHYQLYFDDSLHLTREWSRIKEALNDLNNRCDSNGFLLADKNTWLFIDWVNQEKWTTLQILWWWAQNSGVKLAQRIGDNETANYWINSSNRLKNNLSKIAWSEKEQIWLSTHDSIREYTRHPNFMAVVSGLSTSNQNAGIKALLENDSIKLVGTPYMENFEVMAMARLGSTDYMLKRMNDYWGGMLNKGATTFWEAYNPNETFENQYSFYKRPYGKSLCHAWSAGPAAFLPSELFGLKPIEDGWKRFSIDPNIGNLEWASVCLPTKYGNIIINIENNNIQIVIPKGTTLEWKGNLIVGPKILKDKL